MHFSQKLPIASFIFCRDFTANYNGKKYDANGPPLLTRVYKAFCNVSTDPISFPEICNNSLQVLPRDLCFPIFHENDDSKKFYELSTILDNLGDAFFVHVWSNFIYAKPRIPTNSEIGYIQLARKFCPLMLEAAGDWM